MAKDILSQLATKVTSSVRDNFERKISSRGAVRAGKGFTLFILNEDMDHVIRTIKSLGHSCVLIHGVAETVKREIKEQEGGFLDALLAPTAA